MTEAQQKAAVWLSGALGRSLQFSHVDVHAHIDVSTKKRGEGIVSGVNDEKPRPASHGEAATVKLDPAPSK